MDTPFRVLSLCSGIGGLELGLRLAVPTARTVCAVERESYCVAAMVAQMEAGAVDACPIWLGDLAAFDGRPWRGAVDCVAAGFPCQPWSAAGSGGGTTDERWIWPAIARIITEIEPAFVFLENVRGLVAGGELSCLCGWIDRWGGMRHDRAQQDHATRLLLQRACRDWDERQGTESAGMDADHIWRQYQPDAATRYGAMGSGQRMAHLRGFLRRTSSYRSNRS